MQKEFCDGSRRQSVASWWRVRTDRLATLAATGFEALQMQCSVVSDRSNNASENWNVAAEAHTDAGHHDLAEGRWSTKNV